MRFVDAHIHLSDEEYEQKVNQIVEDAKQSGVVALVSNSMNLQTSIQTLHLSKKFPGLVYSALGIHPWNATQLSNGELKNVVDLILRNVGGKELVALGEIGLDYAYARRKEHQNRQFEVFHRMLQLAEKTSLPVIVHSRGTLPQIMELLPSYNLKGVLLHWFSSPIDLLKQVIDRGYYLSEGPPVVYSKRIQEVIRQTPIVRILTETDGPVSYWGPFRAKMTTPSFLPLVVRAIAQIKRMGEAEVADQILQNSSNFFDVDWASSVEGL